jgi:hypothetical protein
VPFPVLLAGPPQARYRPGRCWGGPPVPAGGPSSQNMGGLGNVFGGAGGGGWGACVLPKFARGSGAVWRALVLAGVGAVPVRKRRWEIGSYQLSAHPLSAPSSRRDSHALTAI